MWFPVNPPPANAVCTSVSEFKFKSKTFRIVGLPDKVLDALEAAFPGGVESVSTFDFEGKTFQIRGLPEDARIALQAAFPDDVKTLGDGTFKVSLVPPRTKIKIP